MAQTPTSTDWLTAAMTLTRFAGPMPHFWAQYLSLVRSATHAAEAGVYSRDGSSGVEPWQGVIAQTPDINLHLTPDFLRQLKLTGQAAGIGAANRYVQIVTIPMGLSKIETVLFTLFSKPPTNTNALSTRLSTLATVPVLFDGARKIRAGARDAQRFGQALGLVGNMLDASGFDMTAAIFANRLSELFACETTYLCWSARVGQKLRAVSHSEMPDRRSQETALIEEVAQEALTQQCEVMFPSVSKVVSFAAERYAELAKPRHMITLPFIHYAKDGKRKELGAVVLCRQRSAFSEAEQWALRLFCEMGQPILEEAFQRKSWLIKRIGREIGHSLPRAIQAKTIPGKVLLGAAVIGLVGLMFVPIPFRISATAIIKTDAMGFVGAPYSGFIEDSGVILGDKVEKGQVLFTLSDTELRLERDGKIALLAQANRDAETNRSLGKFPEMLVAQAKSEEIVSQLTQLDLQIGAAQGISPLSGVVVKGEPAKRLGQAVSRGEEIVTVAALTGLYIEAAISEQDLSFITPEQTAELTLLANPQERFDLLVEEIIPSATVQDASNVFPTRMKSQDSIKDWWLPGMTGIIKIDAGQASLGWVMSRRMIDYLRLKLWF